MRIAYIANVRMPTEKAHGIQIIKTCEALVRLGHTVELIVPDRATHISGDPFAYYGVQASFPMHRLAVLDTAMYGRFGFLLQSFTFAWSVRRYLRHAAYDAVYSRDEHILAFQRQPFVWESHTGAWNYAARKVAQRARHLVVISNGLKDFYRARGISEDKITVAHDGIDLEHFAHPQSKAEARVRLQLPTGKKIAMYIGRLDGWKGSVTVLEAARHLPDDFQVVMIGGETAQVQELSIRYPGVRFLGFRPYKELADNMAAADVLVLPNTGTDVISAKFTSPLKLFAYMASGIPIVASDLPSIREVVDRDSAVLVSPDDAVALAAGIEKAAQEGNSRAERARTLVATYSWDQRAKRVGDAFVSI